jgi:hypothetical protein
MTKNADVEKISILKNLSILRYVECVFIVNMVKLLYGSSDKGGDVMDAKRDKRGRWVKRVQGEYSDRVFSMRLTDKEYSLVMCARDKGLSVRRVLIDTLRDRMGEHEKG